MPTRPRRPCESCKVDSETWTSGYLQLQKSEKPKFCFYGDFSNLVDFISSRQKISHLWLEHVNSLKNTTCMLSCPICYVPQTVNHTNVCSVKTVDK